MGRLTRISEKNQKNRLIQSSYISEYDEALLTAILHNHQHVLSLHQLRHLTKQTGYNFRQPDHGLILPEIHVGYTEQCIAGIKISAMHCSV